MAKRGPKPKYDPVFVEHARRLCKLGSTMQELADYFGVARCTIAVWSAQHPDFGQALTQGRMEADSVIADRLYEKVKGYEVEALQLSTKSVAASVSGEPLRPAISTRAPAPLPSASKYSAPLRLL
jgi:hypothetical protein